MERTHTKKWNPYIDAPMAQNIQKSTYLLDSFHFFSQSFVVRHSSFVYVIQCPSHSLGRWRRRWVRCSATSRSSWPKKRTLNMGEKISSFAGRMKPVKLARFNSFSSDTVTYLLFWVIGDDERNVSVKHHFSSMHIHRINRQNGYYYLLVTKNKYRFCEIELYFVRRLVIRFSLTSISHVSIANRITDGTFFRGLTFFSFFIIDHSNGC